MHDHMTYLGAEGPCNVHCFKRHPNFIMFLFSEAAINQDAEMCNAAMEQGNPQV